jgi:ribosomal protein S18 acetylase RimI-like enzyme
MALIIEQPGKLDDFLYDSILHLLPQLSHRHPLPSFKQVDEILSSESSTIFVARISEFPGSIAGIATLVIFRVPSGIRAHIEDLVVDKDMRNRGIARALMNKALESAQSSGADGVILTSNSRRYPAIKLYESLGFKKWETNLFYYQFDE